MGEKGLMSDSARKRTWPGHSSSSPVVKEITRAIRSVLEVSILDLWTLMHFCQVPVLLSHRDRDRNTMRTRMPHHIVNLCLANAATIPPTLEHRASARLVGNGDDKRIEHFCCTGDMQRTVLQLLKSDKWLCLFWDKPRRETWHTPAAAGLRRCQSAR